MGMPMDLVGIGNSASIIIQPTDEPDERMSADEFFDFCQANSVWRIERSAEGEIIIMPPVGLDSGDHEGEVFGQLRDWAKRDRRGRAIGSNTGFWLRNGAMLSPDAAWISLQQHATLTAEERRKFPPLCPEFVVEIQSPSDSVPGLKRKMQEWIDNGAQLGWLILPDSKTVHIYRPGVPPETLRQPLKLAGEGPVEGFELDLTDIWSDV